MISLGEKKTMSCIEKENKNTYPHTLIHEKKNKAKQSNEDEQKQNKAQTHLLIIR